MMLFVYRFCTLCLNVLLFPILYLPCVFSAHWRMRMGFSRLRGKFVWFHCASVGEVNGIFPLLQKLTLPSDVQLLMTTMTVTGWEQAQKKCAELTLPARTCLIPLDFPGAVALFLRGKKITHYVGNETEFWPNLFGELIRRKTEMFIVNGRISDFSWKRYSQLRKLLQPLLSKFAMIFVQTGKDKQRFETLGAKAVQISGNTKYDFVPQMADSTLHFGDDPIFVAGSTRPGEEEIVLDAFLMAKKKIPSLKLILAPRHLSRKEEIQNLLNQRKLPFSCRSQSQWREDILFLDTLGELLQAYRIATAAFVGGTLFSQYGGHNVLEPAYFGKPVCFGPYVRNCRDVAAQLLEVGGAYSVQNAEDIADFIQEMCLDSVQYQKVCQQAIQVARNQQGAVERILQYWSNHFGDMR